MLDWTSTERPNCWQHLNRCTGNLILNWKAKGKPIHHPLASLANENHEAGPLSYLKLAFRIASLHARIAPASLRDDLVSVAVEALVEGWKNSADEQDVSLYIIRKIHSACTEFIRKEHPSINSTRHFQKDKSLEVRVERLGKRDVKDSHDNANELWEHILSVAENPFERDILNLRREGYTDKEIASLRGVSTSHIFYIRKMLQTRFEILERRHEET